MIGLPISIFITGDRAKVFDWISVTTVCIDLSIDAMTNFLNAISIHCSREGAQPRGRLQFCRRDRDGPQIVSLQGSANSAETTMK